VFGIALQDGHDEDEALEIFKCQHVSEFEMPSPVAWKIAHTGGNGDSK